jgi:hypothetical protein
VRERELLHLHDPSLNRIPVTKFPFDALLQPLPTSHTNDRLGSHVKTTKDGRPHSPPPTNTSPSSPPKRPSPLRAPPTLQTGSRSSSSNATANSRLQNSSQPCCKTLDPYLSLQVFTAVPPEFWQNTPQHRDRRLPLPPSSRSPPLHRPRRHAGAPRVHPLSRGIVPRE